MSFFPNVRRSWKRFCARRGWRSFTCPFCFERVRLTELVFRCENSQCRSPKPDTVLARVWNEESFARTFAVDKARFFASCPTCMQKSHVRICPHCHKALPDTFGLQDDFIIAVIGARNVGKSHFLAVLIEHIRQQVGLRFNMSIEFVDEDTHQRYMEHFYTPIFRDQRTIEATPSARTAPLVRTPLLYRLSRRDHANTLEELGTLAFFDTAGEDLDNLDTIQRLNKYILNADGIILLLDPLQVDAVREKLPNIPLPPKESNPLDIMQRLTNLFLRQCGTENNKKITTPVAVCYSKFDTLYPLMDPSSQLLHKAAHNGHFDIRDCEAIQGEVEAMLFNWGHAGLLNLLKVRYQSSAFFCISSLGSAPDGTRISTVKPIRVEDPFLWLLYQSKKIT